MTAAFAFRNENGIGAELTLQPGGDPYSSLVDLGLTAPEPELATLGGDEFIGDQRQPGDATARTVGGQPVEPAIELPSHPIGDGGVGQRPFVAPEAEQLLAVFGLGLDADPHTGDSVAAESAMKFVSEGAGEERHPVNPVGWRIDLVRHSPVDRRSSSVGRALVESARKAMGAESVGAETSEDVGCRQVGERSQRTNPKTAKNVDQLWAFEYVNLHRSEKPGDLATRDETGGIGRACGELGGKGAVGHTDPNVGASGDDLGEALVDEAGDGGIAAEIAQRSSHHERTSAGPGDLDSWGDVVECGDNRFEQSGFTGLVTFVKCKRGTPTLGGTAPHAPGDPPGPGTGRGRHDAVGVHDRHRLGKIDTGGDDGPVGTPGDEGADRRTHAASAATAPPGPGTRSSS